MLCRLNRKKKKKETNSRCRSCRDSISLAVLRHACCSSVFNLSLRAAVETHFQHESIPFQLQALVCTAAGKFFCNGFDLRWIQVRVVYNTTRFRARKQDFQNARGALDTPPLFFFWFTCTRAVRCLFAAEPYSKSRLGTRNLT